MTVRWVSGVLVGLAIMLGAAPPASAVRPCDSSEITHATVAATQRLPGDPRWWGLTYTTAGVGNPDEYYAGTLSAPGVKVGEEVRVRVQLMGCAIRPNVLGTLADVRYTELAVVPYRDKSFGIRLTDPGPPSAMGEPVAHPDGTIRWPGEVALPDTGGVEEVEFAYKATQPGQQYFAIQARRSSTHVDTDGTRTPGTPRLKAVVGGVTGKGSAQPPEPSPDPLKCSGEQRKVQIGYAMAQGCFEAAPGGRLRTAQAVTIGGFRAVPGAGAAVVLDTGARTIRADGQVAVTWAGMPVPGGVSAIVAGQRSFRFDLDGLEKGLTKLGVLKAPVRFPLRKVELLWESDGERSTISATLDLSQLPLPKGIRALTRLDGAAQRPLTLKLGATNERGGPDPSVFTLTFERVGLDAALRKSTSTGPSLFLPLTKAELRRDRTVAGYPWVLEGEFDTSGGGKGPRLPGRFPKLSIRLLFGEHWDDGLDGGGLSAGDLGIRFMAGLVPLELDKLGADLTFQPFGARAAATVGLLTKLPVPGVGDVYPLQLDGEVGLLSLAKGSCKPLKYVVSVNGKLTIPLIEKLGGRAAAEATFCAGAGGLKLGDTAVLGGVPVAVGATVEGTLDVNFAGFELASGTLGAWVFPRSFQVEAHGRASLLGLVAANARALINNRAFAACGSIEAVGQPVVVLGVAYRWEGGGVEVVGCDLAPWRLEKPQAARAAQAPGSLRVRVPRGQRRFGLRIGGQGGAPSVVVRAPDGTALQTGDQPQLQAGAVALRSPVDPASYVFVRRPQAGVWTIEPLPGSVPLAGVQTARAVPPLRPRVRVSGRGARRILRWRLGLARGDRARFVVRGAGVAQTVGTTSARRGRLRFGAGGPPGRRAVYVVRERAGAGLERRRVARFRVAAPGRLRAPRGVRARAGRRAVRVTWRGVPGAARYRVQLRAGRRAAPFAVVTRGRSARFAVGRVGRSARVEVRAMRADRALGRAAVVRALDTHKPGVAAPSREGPSVTVRGPQRGDGRRAARRAPGVPPGARTRRAWCTPVRAGSRPSWA